MEKKGSKIAALISLEYSHRRNFCLSTNKETHAFSVTERIKFVAIIHCCVRKWSSNSGKMRFLQIFLTKFLGPNVEDKSVYFSLLNSRRILK